MLALSKRSLLSDLARSLCLFNKLGTLTLQRYEDMDQALQEEQVRVHPRLPGAGAGSPLFASTKPGGAGATEQHQEAEELQVSVTGAKPASAAGRRRRSATEAIHTSSRFAWSFRVTQQVTHLGQVDQDGGRTCISSVPLPAINMQ